MQQQKTLRWVALVLAIVGLLHGLRHADSYWFGGALVGFAVGGLLLAMRASRKTSCRARY